MNAKNKSLLVSSLSLILISALTLFETSVTYALPIVRVTPIVVQINSFNNFKHFDIPGAIGGLEVTHINDSGQVAGT